ncbi:type II toxin-antitoxin system toxin DNA ADP-ribosyl transferase DarT [Pseudoalteromonas fuliginea]|uniref:DarT domain-containing protein n=1 Tax=Pseudoalteromonas fuliginea TaxID=1872678 RepID=A0ABD3Y431_9GAMM|nr:DUF4433 domain-containing protein [Pseudoalteromonas fuliginea]KDC48460.1 hypothetical protein DC53_19915 [Pseudoalteromonas fuliginea]KJZ21903.1 hypothetical protein TW82_19960 [Pseudoalteromonas fuliginea]
MAQVPLPTPIYHFTHISNLSSLISSGGVICKNGVDSSSIIYRSAAYDSVQGHREIFKVPVAPGGLIHDYVPFYFNSRSPMLFAVHRGNIPGVSMSEVVFFKTTAQTIEGAGKLFVFTDGHGIMDLTDYYNNLNELSEVPWDVVNAKYWTNFVDGRRLRQSEFLVHSKLDWELIETIGVYNQIMKDRVEGLIQHLVHKPSVEIKLSWYF